MQAESWGGHWAGGQQQHPGARAESAVGPLPQLGRLAQLSSHRCSTFSCFSIPSPASTHAPRPEEPLQTVPCHPSATSQFSHPNRVPGLLSCRTPTPLLLPPLRCGAHLSRHNCVATAWRTPGTHSPPQPQGPTRVPPIPRTQPDTRREQSPRFGTGSKLQRLQYRRECQRRERALGPQGPSCWSCCSAPVITHPLPALPTLHQG